MKIKNLIQQNAKKLKNAGIESFMLDSQLLLAYVLNVKKQDIILNPNREIPLKNILAFENLVSRREKREPLQYIIEKCEFFGMEFCVNEHVLTPRPDTETLVASVLAMADMENILEIGTGSGVIAVALGKHLPKSRITAIDISNQALDVAKHNAEKNGVANITFLQGDIFNFTLSQNYDIIISNPPYVESKKCALLQPEVSEYEPRLALDGGSDGLDFYRQIAEIVRNSKLNSHPYIALEIGENQTKAIEKIFDNHNFALENAYKDLSGTTRVLMFK